VDEHNVISYIMKLNANISAIPSVSINCVSVKAKFTPITYHDDTEGEQRYSYTLSLTKEGERAGSLKLPPSHFKPKNNQGTTVQKAGWDPGLVWPCAGKSFPHPDLIPRPSTPVSRYTDAIPAHILVLDRKHIYK
jgi:hypothetical protein